MGLESGTWVSDLVKTNPTSSDDRSQGDDHLRLIKTVLQNTFPNAGKAFYLPDTAAKTADFSVTSAQMNVTFLVDTSGGNVAMTLPTLASGDAGWFCYLMKTTTDGNAIFVTPPSGTIQSGALSGLAKTRRAIPGVACKVWWTGSAWIAERAERAPVGAIIDFDGASLPAGYELPNGQTLAGTAGSVYPDFYAAKSSLVTRDITGRVIAMKEASATRLTSGVSGVDGGTLGATGGDQNLHQHTHTATSVVTDPGHTHPKTPQITSGASQVGVGSEPSLSLGGPPNYVNSNSATTGVSVATTNANAGSGASQNVQPTIVLNKLLVVE